MNKKRIIDMLLCCVNCTISDNCFCIILEKNNVYTLMMQSDENQIYDPLQLFFVAVKFLEQIKDIDIDEKRKV